ncbi:unnamed protein product [Owenia fusiformis]|uniref:Uncharacterized protein n=1 Tax=Owenia fusiformis TaxID=6347 RepID=A0A8J1U8D7_OWEFU|nr:unnamed protein product [Owenia fusiformis]
MRMNSPTGSVDYESDTPWYENDLQLAAELGKTLLERNKELEHQVALLQQENHEKELEVDFLAKQVDTLRDLGESRSRVYDEVDKNSHKLEHAMKRQTQQSHNDKQKINRLNDTISSLETKCENLQATLEELRKTDRKRKRRERRSTVSVPTEKEVLELFHFYNLHTKDNEQLHSIFHQPSQNEIQSLKDHIKELRDQVNVQKAKYSELDTDFGILEQENKHLTERIQDQEHKEIDLIKDLEHKYEKQLQDIERSNATKMCRSCQKQFEQHEKEAKVLEPKVEYDVENVRQGVCVRLKSGGSAFGSRESLNKAGLETSDDLVTSLTDNSLLSELDQQYHSLVEKYESLIDSRNKKISTKEVQTTVIKSSITTSISVKSPKKIDQHRFDHGPPEYKKLFKEIFDTLKKSTISEAASGKDDIEI